MHIVSKGPDWTILLQTSNCFFEDFQQYKWFFEQPVSRFNKELIDERFGNSLWRWSYDYPVKGKQDISNIDDPEFVALRRRRNTAVTCMYWIFFLGFFVLMNFSAILKLLFIMYFFDAFLKNVLLFSGVTKKKIWPTHTKSYFHTFSL